MIKYVFFTMKFLLYLITVTNLLTHYVSGEPDRISGGKPIKPGEYPYFVQLLVKQIDFPNNNTYEVGICGATLIHPKWILTAAHCFKTVSMTPPQMFTDGWVQAIMETEIAIDDIIRNPESNFTYRSVQEAHIHPKYIYKNEDGNIYMESDVALAKLKESFDVNAIVVDLPIVTVTQLCNIGTIIGAGDVRHGESSRLVRYTPIQSKTKDQLTVKPPFEIPTHFYSEIKWYKGHALQGDSGGPFICNDKAYPVQYGIISMNSEVPDLKIIITAYETVEHYKSFIRKYVPLDSFHKKVWRVKKEHKDDVNHSDKEVKSKSIKRNFSFICLYINVIPYVMLHGF